MLFRLLAARQAAARNCENAPVSLVMKYCLSDFNNDQKSCIHANICSICLVVIACQFILHTVTTEDLSWHGYHYPKARLSWSRVVWGTRLSLTTGCPVRSWKVSCSSQIPAIAPLRLSSFAEAIVRKIISTISKSAGFWVDHWMDSWLGKLVSAF